MTRQQAAEHVSHLAPIPIHASVVKHHQICVGSSAAGADCVQRTRKVIVIAVEEKDVVGAGLPNPQVAGLTKTSVGLGPDQRDLRVDLRHVFDDLQRTIRRVILDDHDLVPGLYLIQHRLNTLTHVASHIIDWYYNSERRHNGNVRLNETLRQNGPAISTRPSKGRRLVQCCEVDAL